MKTRALFILLWLPFVTYSQVKQGAANQSFKGKMASEQERFSIFRYAFNEQWRESFVVVKVKNLNTGKTAEVCTHPAFLMGAIRREYGDGGHMHDSLIEKNNKRYFEFRNEEAIRNIGLDTYTLDDLSAFEKIINFDTIVARIGRTQDWSKELHCNEDHKLMRMWAHALFNRGILTGESTCFGGSLYYIDRTKKRR